MKLLSSFQRNIIRTTLKALICFTMLRFCEARNSFPDLDLSSQTLNPSSTGFMITGNAVSDRFGTSVSTAGDINNDGYDDIIVGAYSKNSYQGVAYVIYGGEGSLFLDIDLSTTSLDPLTTGFMITGSAYDRLGSSVSTAGDINNDGYDDIIIGANGKNSYQGAAYVIYGGEKSSMSNWDFSSGATLNPSTTGFMITGNSANNYFGQSVSTAGDINNDGYDDIIIGAFGENSNKGAAYVIYGGENSKMFNIVLGSTTLNPTSTGFMIAGNAASDQFGRKLSTAGDINNDGFDDFIIGAYCKNSNHGAAYLIYGGPKSSMSNIDLSTQALNSAVTGFTITGNAINDYLGYSVSTAGDINNDGYDDIIIGAAYKNSYQGAAYVIYGGDKSTMSNWDFSSGATLNPSTTGFMITGNSANNYFGQSVSTAGDINNDGYDDIIIGAYEKNTAYVIYGGAKSSMSNIDLSSTTLDPLSTGFAITGSVAGDGLGISVSTAGDINNDGYDDIIIGAYRKNSDHGAAYVIFASCSNNCKQCSSESVCTQCKTSYLMYHSECFASCPDATLATSSTICEDCPANCKYCSTTSVCTECKDSYISYQSQCLDSCPDGMFLSTTTCEECTSPCSKCSSTSVCAECISPYALYGSQCLTSCPKTMFNSNNICKDCPSYCSSCISQDVCQVCFQGFTLFNSLCALPSAPASVSNSASNSSSPSSSYQGTQEKATQAISSVTQGIGSVVSVGSAVFPLSALVSKIIQSTRYLNLYVTSELAEVYQTWRTDLISWDVPNVMSDLDYFKTTPLLFAQYDVDSPFLVNFWPTLINIGIGFGTFIACIVLRKFCEYRKYEGQAYSLLQKFVAGSFNFTLVQAYAGLDDILFYLVLDAKANPFNSSFSWASISCAVIFLVAGCLLVFFNFWTVKKYQSIKNQGITEINVFNEKHKYWQLFYSDFSDDNFWCQSFFGILIIRSTLSSLIITVLYYYPLMQTVFLMILDVAIISFLYFKTPFNTLRGKLAQYYYEIITLLVHICTFILSLQDRSKTSSDTITLTFSTSIIYLNTALVCGAIGFMFIEIYKTISQRTRAAQRKQYETIAIQTGTEDILMATSEDQYLKTETNRRPENDTDQLQVSCFENSHLFTGINHGGETDQSGLNLESSQILNLKSNLNAENSKELDMDPSRDLSTIPIIIRRRLRTENPKQQQNNL